VAVIARAVTTQLFKVEEKAEKERLIFRPQGDYCEARYSTVDIPFSKGSSVC
jgi:hypothetical protein